MVDQIILSVNAPDKEFLNIYPPVLKSGDGSTMSLDGLIADASISSRRKNHEEDDLRAEIRAGSLIHSAREIYPTLRIKLKSPVFVEEICIQNREDVYHKRARYLNLKAFHSGRLVAEFQNSSPAQLVKMLARICEVVSFDLPAQGPLDVPQMTDEISSRIQDHALRGKLNLEYREFPYLLPMFDGVADPDPYQEAICAALIVAILGEKTYAGTKDLKIVSQFLHSGEAIEKCRKLASKIANMTIPRNCDLTISKHQIHFSRLVQRKDVHLDGMEKLFSIFDYLGIPLMLCYGTLLGAIRQGSFLAHDDDVDLLYVDGCSSQDEIVENQRRLIDRLNTAGIKCDPVTLGKNFHAFVGGVSLDLFPCWQEGDKTFLLMEQMRYRSIPTALLLPTATATLHGRKFNAPANPQSFLAERYGPTWQTPDIYYGWPWKVSDRISA